MKNKAKSQFVFIPLFLSSAINAGDTKCSNATGAPDLWSTLSIVSSISPTNCLLYSNSRTVWSAADQYSASPVITPSISNITASIL